MAVTLGGSSNIGLASFGNETVILPIAINHIIITADFDGLLISTNKGQTFISISSGTHSFRVGLTTEIIIESVGNWQFIGELS